MGTLVGLGGFRAADFFRADAGFTSADASGNFASFTISTPMSGDSSSLTVVGVVEDVGGAAVVSSDALDSTEIQETS